jgi:hypothetical protein
MIVLLALIENYIDEHLDITDGDVFRRYELEMNDL